MSEQVPVADHLEREGFRPLTFRTRGGQPRSGCSRVLTRSQHPRGIRRAGREGGIVERFFPDDPIPSEQWLNAFVDYWNVPGTWESLSENRRDAWRGRFDKVFAEVHHLCIEEHDLAYWAEVTTPTLITVSEGVTPHEGAVCRLLAEHLPNATLRQTPGGHLSPVTHPGEVFPMLLEAIALDAS